MTTERKEVAVESLHVKGFMGCTLGSIDEYGNAMLMGDADDVGNGILGAQHIAHMGDADEARAVGEQLAEGIEVKAIVVAQGDDTQADATLRGLQLPRHDVGVVFHLADDNLVALLHLALAERLCHEVDGLGGATCEDNLFYLAGVDETAHPLTGSLMEVGGLLREIVDATMYIGIHVQIFVAHGIEHTQRLLRCGGVVEVDQRSAIDLARQNGEVLTDGMGIVHGRGFLWEIMGIDGRNGN